MDFVLRPWVLADKENLAYHANNPKIAKFLTNQFPHPYTIDDAHKFIKMTLCNSPRNILAIDINNLAVGGIGIHPQNDIHSKNAELGYWLSEEYWGKGIMTQAIKEIVPYGFKNFDINRIFARPFGSNMGSQKVLEKAGFILEAKFDKTLFKNGVYLDELIYAVRRE